MKKGKFLMFVTRIRKPQGEREGGNHQPFATNYDIQTFIMDQTLPSSCSVMGAMPRRSRTFWSVRAGMLMSLWRNRCHQQRRKRQREKTKQEKGKGEGGRPKICFQRKALELEINKRPDRFGSVDGASACGLKGPGFDSGQGHVPWLRAHPQLRSPHGKWGTGGGCRGMQVVPDKAPTPPVAPHTEGNTQRGRSQRVGNCGGLLDGAPLTGQLPLLLDSLLERAAWMQRTRHLEGESGCYRKPEKPGKSTTTAPNEQLQTREHHSPSGASTWIQRSSTLPHGKTSRVSNAPVLRNIRRSSRRNHRLLSRETTLKEHLSSRKIRGKGGGGGQCKEADFWSHAFGSDPLKVMFLDPFHKLDFYPPSRPASTSRRRKGGRGKAAKVISQLRAPARSVASAPPGLLFPSSPPPPRIGSDSHIPSAFGSIPWGV
ncbi:hypothetical protein QTO34_004528 [Cnephaeus nilssonii]|uniref:Uncharacterized protein n=1 Tax=Cnephaeus nilssonii TaxID=3371016 RepID=A0AA40HQ76_CNENI|nr:hypothetical protein QTO34_004528 [Eptesicus nilssonii]